MLGLVSVAEDGGGSQGEFGLLAGCEGRPKATSYSDEGPGLVKVRHRVVWQGTARYGMRRGLGRATAGRTRIIVANACDSAEDMI